MTSILLRGLLFSMLWWVLTGGRSDSWGVGLVSVVLAVIFSLFLWPSKQSGISFTNLLSFAGFFLMQSVQGGVQVAAITLRPQLAIAPAILELPITLPPGPGRVVLINTLNLLPGTISIGIEKNVLRLHTLNERWPTAERVREIETRIALMLGVAP